MAPLSLSHTEAQTRAPGTWQRQAISTQTAAQVGCKVWLVCISMTPPLDQDSSIQPSSLSAPLHTWVADQTAAPELTRTQPSGVHREGQQEIQSGPWLLKRKEIHSHWQAHFFSPSILALRTLWVRKPQMENDGILGILEPPGIAPISSNPPFSKNFRLWDQDLNWHHGSPHTQILSQTQRVPPSFLAGARSWDSGGDSELLTGSAESWGGWSAEPLMGEQTTLALPIPAHFRPKAPPSSSLPLKVPGPRPPGYEKDCVTSWRDRRQHSWAHRRHSPWGWRTLLGQSTKYSFRTDSQDGRDLTVLPCSLSCSHLSQMLQGLTHLSGHQPSSLSWNLSMKPSLTLPPPGKAGGPLSSLSRVVPLQDYCVQLLIMTCCHTVTSFFYYFWVRNNWKFTEHWINKNSTKVHIQLLTKFT